MVCWFRDICPVEGAEYCHYEMLFLGCNPCGDCDQVDGEEEHRHSA